MSGKGTTAYFIGGPKHGDVDKLPEPHREVVIPVGSPSAAELHFTDYGHYKVPHAMSDSYRTGAYRRDARLHGGEFPENSHAYVWQGVRW